MPDTKISALTALSTLAGNDLLPCVDVDDTTMASSGTTKAITIANFFSPAKMAQFNNGSPADGDAWYDSVQRAVAAYLNGLKGWLPINIFEQTADVTVDAGVVGTTETTLVGSGLGSLTIPANWWQIGKAIRLHAMGVFTTSASPANWNHRLYFGSTRLAQVGAGSNIASASAYSWEIEAEIVCRTTGATGTLVVCGYRGNFATSAMNVWNGLSSGGPVTVDTTTQQALDLRQIWEANTSGNTITCSVLSAVARN